MDQKDRGIIACLTADARTSLKDLASEIGLSSPSIAERIRRLEQIGIIKCFTVDLDPKALGYALEAVVRIRPMPGKVQPVERLIIETPQIIECSKVTGDDCFVATLHVRSMEEIDKILEKISEKASTSTSLVKRKIVERRAPPLT
ncbi:Lrp/AsnC family transcriptional regulator [Oceaniovalibus sp. ACAM 378]|uniref:Lrp/AsnC family transcriptional regulator n=1 Tax=Oceaniovalibus sp. ACAM 378 TaxID=2599923 RepID=UPI0011D5DDA0|nr:Lrp/AsnC family transcriptional regulator [Oceaniovalibus sp. ACAM 378]TYB86084.1 Lrp/AsnC family transcriptional regulator [Oceaniovalibus sp. ACAM 378]